MLNTEHAYHEAGYKTARARIERNESRAKHWREYFRKMQAHENEADRREADRLFNQGYAEAQPARRAY
jgi:hypothetical protein